MPELIAFKTRHFECVIWAKDISASIERLGRTMQDRNKPVPVSIIRFQPAITLEGENAETAELDCGKALFFENKQYDIEFIFDASLKNSFITNPPQVHHRLKYIEDSFHYSPRNHSLRATVNTANDIGWFRIELQYPVEGRICSQAISIEVLPTKIDMASEAEIFSLLKKLITEIPADKNIDLKLVVHESNVKLKKNILYKLVT